MVAKSLVKAPPLFLEYAFYVLTFNSIFHILPIPFLEMGGNSAIASLCVLFFGRLALTVYKPIALALGCAISIVLIQVIIHEELIISVENIKTFIKWAVSLVVIQSLAVRKGFFHRFAIFALFAGLCMIPFLRFSAVDRAGAEGVSLGSANAIGMWFGYCFTYFMIAGLEAKNIMVRTASWAGGGFSLVMMGFSVSRGPILASAIAVAWAFKKVLKRSFLPVIGLLFVCFIVYITGIVDSLVDNYLQRGTEDTGRFYLWEVGFDRFLDSWWVGVGLSNTGIERPGYQYPLSPHNPLLLIGLSSGVVPLAFFMGYLWSAGRRALQIRNLKSANAHFLFPMFLYGMLETMLLGEAFMSPWFMVLLSTMFLEQNNPHLGQIRRKKLDLKGQIHASPLSSPTTPVKP